MAHSTPQGIGLLNGFKRVTRFDKGLGAQLPEAYKKFWREWKVMRPAAVHYIPKENEWERDEITGQIKSFQNVDIPLIDTPESHEGIWGGEAVIKGFQKRSRTKRRVPHFWVPTLRRSVVHSDVLKKHISVVLTDRTLEKIHESRGFDHYLLKYPACDLRSILALKIKRHILLELLNGCPTHNENPNEQERILKEYQCYLEAYTIEEIDWYGHTYQEAIKKLLQQIRKESATLPHKVEFRMKLLEQLRNTNNPNDNTVETSSPTNDDSKIAKDKISSTEAIKDKITEIADVPKQSSDASTSSWLSRINPFGRKQT
ncbi:39S ribosomal protein L28, mitochondrial [Teleopsis dalmanni]|uniref:39S ribosomal protein L28, mitochondrial n=1 Tax=Teleopsis dalmanni TaxID=139649 RepID=UPI0018CEEDED|nr:39S ribosomal protein L28, mitochondrial [Teleopsis dalmanni]XP_037960781.1 39S ribosomal protein L28, mitochondrial [Teleopsis dalmanni]XP_037960782.1 39S ribosomal protein L28, mitochondrial [Teleopsis dalmanni]